MTQVLLIDDDAQICASIQQSLELAGISVTSYSSAITAFSNITRDFGGVVVSDVRMPDMDGLELSRKIFNVDPDLPVVLITGHGHVSMAVRAIRSGTYDFIEKPFRPETLITVVKRALEKRQLTMDNRKLRDQLNNTYDLEKVIIGASPGMVDLRENLKRCAQADVDVLIYGESGTGKELIARSLHNLGPRRNRNFVAINCAAIPQGLSSSELFGHVAGAFTGASVSRKGKFEYADKGVIFLDEIESMPMELQAELLRVLQERSIVRLGSNTEVDLDVRVFSASKANLLDAADKGKFRADLYFRLDVVSLHVLPLRERIEDVPLLFQHFINQHASEQDVEAPLLTSELYDRLISYSWPGNVRELQNNARRFALGFDPGIGTQINEPSTETDSLNKRVAQYEQQMIKQAIKQFEGNVSKAADHLQISRRTLYNKLGR